MGVEFWISYNNGAEKLQLPVNPESINVKTIHGYTDVIISQFGEYTVMGERGATELTLSSFFPAQYNASYCEYSDLKHPSECISIIERWRDERKPLRLIVTRSNVNIAVTIRDFEYEVQRAGSAGDVYYSMSFKEYRFLDTKATAKDVKKKPKPAKKKRPPVVNKGSPKAKAPYTVKSGDSLWKIFGKNWRKAYNLNRKVIGSNPNLIHPGQKLKWP